MTAMMTRLSDVSERDLSLIDLAFSMASAREIVLRRRPRDAAILSAKGEMVKRLVVKDDAADIEEEILRALTEIDADALTKVMPPSQSTLEKLPRLGINKAILGGRLDQAQVIPKPLRLIDGLLEDEVDVLNRAWLKRSKTGTPYVTGLQILGLDGVPVDTGQRINWGLEKFDIHGLFLNSGCIVNPEHLPDWSTLLNDPPPGSASIQILGQRVDLEYVRHWHSMAALLDQMKRIRSNQIIWCVRRNSLAELVPSGALDELVTYVIPALEGRVSTWPHVTNGQGSLIGNSFRIEARLGGEPTQ